MATKVAKGLAAARALSSTATDGLAGAGRALGDTAGLLAGGMLTAARRVLGTRQLESRPAPETLDYAAAHAEAVAESDGSTYWSPGILALVRARWSTPFSATRSRPPALAYLSRNR